MADKFLETADMEEIKEGIRMTRLGQMLVKEGAERKAIEIAGNLIGLLADEAIMEKVGISREMLEKIKQGNNTSMHNNE